MRSRSLRNRPKTSALRGCFCAKSLSTVDVALAPVEGVDPVVVDWANAAPTPKASKIEVKRIRVFMAFFHSLQVNSTCRLQRAVFQAADMKCTPIVTERKAEVFQ